MERLIHGAQSAPLPSPTGLQETTMMFPHHMAEYGSTGSEIAQPHTICSNWLGSKPPFVKDAAEIQHYAIWELCARNDIQCTKWVYPIHWILSVNFWATLYEQKTTKYKQEAKIRANHHFHY